MIPQWLKDGGAYLPGDTGEDIYTLNLLLAGINYHKSATQIVPLLQWGLVGTDFTTKTGEAVKLFKTYTTLNISNSPYADPNNPVVDALVWAAIENDWGKTLGPIPPNGGNGNGDTPEGGSKKWLIAGLLVGGLVLLSAKGKG